MLGKSKEEVKIETVIGEETLLQGTIKAKSGVRIDGKFEGGDIEGHTVIVGVSGSVSGDITAQKVIIGGKVTGNITTRSLEIQRNAQVYGDVHTSSLSISEGALYEGHCVMSVAEEKVIESPLRKR